MHIIVTGGTGFIGRALVEDLARDGYEVIVLTRDVSRTQGKLPQGAKAVEWDARTANGWGKYAEGATAIFNLAGSTIGVRWTPQVKAEILNSRIHATQAVVEAIRKATLPPKALIQASAVGYYGHRGDEEITEETPPGNDFLAQVGVEWEKTASQAEAQGVRVCLMRMGVVLEREGGALAKLLPPFRFFVGGPAGGGRQWFPWVHRADVLGAMRFVMEREEAQGAFNTTAPNPLTMREFCRVLGQVLKRPSWLPMPAFALRLLFGEMAEGALLSSQRVLPKRLLQMGYSFQFPTAEQALQVILEEKREGHKAS